MDQCCGVAATLSEVPLFRVDLSRVSAGEALAAMKKILALLAMFFDGSSILESTHSCALFWTRGQQAALQSLVPAASADSPSREWITDCIPGRALLFFAVCCAQIQKYVFDLILFADIYEGKGLPVNKWGKGLDVDGGLFTR